MSTDIQAYDKQRMTLLEQYKAHDHLMKWSAFDKRSGRSQEVIYYPAAWRLYELSLRYPTANFSSEIYHMDQERDFVIVRVRLFLGANYEASEKKTEAYKQGRLTELDKVETKAKARAAREFGIGTEHALDMDDTPEGEVAGTVVNEEKSQQGQLPAQNGAKQLPSPADVLKAQLNTVYEKALTLGEFERGATTQASVEAFLKRAGEILGINITAPGHLTKSRLDTIAQYLESKDVA